MSDRDNEKRITNLEKELEEVKKKLAEKEREEYIEKWYESQKGSGYPPLPHF